MSAGDRGAAAPQQADDWMAPFKTGPADFAARASKQPCAPPVRDATLRSAQDEDALERQIWLLALSEAYATRNLGLLQTMAGQDRPTIVADYYRRHPAMQRFAAAHIEAGTCSEAVRVLREESERRRGQDAPEDRDAAQSEAAATTQSASSSKPAFDAVQAKGLLAGAKVTKLLPQRPSEIEVQSFIRKHFATAPRDPLRKIVTELWGGGKRGPRNPRNGHSQGG